MHRSRLPKKGTNSICRSSAIRKNFEKRKQSGQSTYLGYITAKLQKDIPSSCWDTFNSFNVPANSHWQRYSTLFNLIVLRRLWTLVHKFFSQMLSTPGTVYPENLTGVTSENFCRIAKIGKFMRTQISVDFGTCRPISATTRNIFVYISTDDNDNDNDVYFTLATSDSRIGK